MNESKAVQTLKTRLIGKDQWHGALKFPEIESNETAYGRCVDDNSAKRYCPVRWRSMEKWKNVSITSGGDLINKRINEFSFVVHTLAFLFCLFKRHLSVPGFCLFTFYYKYEVVCLQRQFIGIPYSLHNLLENHCFKGTVVRNTVIRGGDSTCKKHS